MKNKKSKLSREQRGIAGILAVQSAPVVKVNVPYERGTGLQRFTRVYEAQQRVEEQTRRDSAERPIRQAEQQLTETLRAFRSEQAAALFTAPSDELASRCKRIAADQFAGMSVEECRSLIRGAFDHFRSDLEDSEGIRLEAGALQKCQAISKHNLTIDFTDPSVWRALFDYADELGVFSQSDVSRRQVVVQPVVVEQPIDIDSAIEKLDTTTRDGQRKARTMLANHLFSVEAKSVFDEWIASLGNNFDFVPTEDEQRLAIEFFVQRNLSFMNRKSYDDARRVLVARGIFPDRCLTNEDRAAILVEETDARSYQERQALKAKLALLRDGQRPL